MSKEKQEATKPKQDEPPMTVNRIFVLVKEHDIIDESELVEFHDKWVAIYKLVKVGKICADPTIDGIPLEKL